MISRVSDTQGQKLLAITSLIMRKKRGAWKEFGVPVGFEPTFPHLVFLAQVSRPICVEPTFPTEFLASGTSIHYRWPYQ